MIPSRSQSEAEKHLREILAAYDSPINKITDYLENLQRPLTNARWYIKNLDACQYERENGVKCPDEAKEPSFGLNCCPHHAAVRNASLR